jgi:arylsulfatase A
MNRRNFIYSASSGLALSLLPGCVTAIKPACNGKKPNVIYILADDLGYGDVQCLNPKHGKILTPNLDKLAAQGMVFTDAHSTSSVCTPSRYSILTGRYNWRSRLQTWVLGQADLPLIDSTRLTVSGMLQQQGYATGCVGKWHLGMEWPFASDACKQKILSSPSKGRMIKLGDFDWSRPIAEGPISRGFDYYFGADGTVGPPFCFIENDRTVGIPSVMLPQAVLKRASGCVPGPALPGWKLEKVLPTITDKACEFISSRAKEKKPFFLYFPLTSPHTPIVPNAEWKGKSKLSPYADFVMETDAMVGRVLDALEQSGCAGNTLVIFTSDNGCAGYNIPPLMAKGHYPSAQFRGCKAQIWDGGHHIPFILRWPGVVKPGSTCHQLACQMDLMATCAEITGTKIPETAGEDSVSLLPLFKGSQQVVRESLVHHSCDGNFAIRDGNWKLILCYGAGYHDKPAKTDQPAVQLYDMSVDDSEQKNLQAEHPEIVARLTKQLEQIVADGRSTPLRQAQGEAGPKQKNDVPVDIFKKTK